MGIRGSKAQTKNLRGVNEPTSSPASRASSVAKRRIHSHGVYAHANDTSTDTTATATAGADEVKYSSDLAKFSRPEVLKHMDRAAGDERLQKKFDEFNRWLKSNGAEFPALDFRVYADGVRGVYTQCDIPADTQLVKVPLACLITDDMARKTPVGRRLDKFSSRLSVPNHCQVLVYMLLSRKKGNSFFQPYYDILPESFDNFPIFWGKDKLAWLRGSSLVDEIQERRKNMRSDYQTICHAVPEFEQFTFEEFLWCRTAVGSRNFSIIVNGQKVTAMVPLADMLNHFRPRETSWTFDNAQQGFTITSLKSLGGNCQVMDSYGKKCNSKFLLHYGFTIEQNREADGKCQDEVLVNLQLRTQDKDKLHVARLKFVRNFMDVRVSMNHEDPGTQEALRYLRVAVASEFELRQLNTGASNTKALNADNESRVLRLLATVMKDKLQMYPTTIEEDEEVLRSDELLPFSDHRHALIVILSEKRVANFFVQLAERLCPLLGLPRHSRVDAIRRDTARHLDFFRFANGVNRDLNSTRLP